MSRYSRLFKSCASITDTIYPMPPNNAIRGGEGRKLLGFDQAVQEVVIHNDRVMSSPSKREQAAINRLTAFVAAARTGGHKGKAERIVEWLHDLDVVFFGGTLTGHVDAFWREGGVFAMVGTEGYGYVV